MIIYKILSYQKGQERYYRKLVGQYTISPNRKKESDTLTVKALPSEEVAKEIAEELDKCPTSDRLVTIACWAKGRMGLKIRSRDVKHSTLESLRKGFKIKPVTGEVYPKIKDTGINVKEVL